MHQFFFFCSKNIGKRIFLKETFRHVSSNLFFFLRKIFRPRLTRSFATLRRLAWLFADLVSTACLTRIPHHYFICFVGLCFYCFLQINDLEDFFFVIVSFCDSIQNFTSFSTASLCLMRFCFSEFARRICSSMHANTVSHESHHSWSVLTIWLTSPCWISRPIALSTSSCLFFWSNFPWIMSRKSSEKM